MILVLADHDNGDLVDATLQTLALARSAADMLDTDVEAIAVGADASSMAEELGRHGAGRVHAVTENMAYAPGVWAASVVHLTGSSDVDAIMAPGTDRGSEVMARVAARLQRPLAAQSVGIESIDDGVWHLTRQRWGGSLLEEAELDGGPALLTVAPHELAPSEHPVADVQVEEIRPDMAEADRAVQLTEHIESEAEGVPLADARVVIGGGRGVGGEDGFEQLEELADLLNGAVGGSRVATNNGWREHDDQIGQTGNRIAPDLYIACGISGAIQHMVGCSGAKRILAINTDRDAPIVERADYAVIGDLHEIVPAIIDELKQANGKG